MATLSPQQQTEASKSSVSTIVPTTRGRYVRERGLLALDENGISYMPIARSRGNIVAAVGVALWGAFLITNGLRGGFIGFV